MTAFESSKPLRLLLVGASGVVGQQVLLQALADPRFARVLAISRTELGAHNKLENHVVDFANLPGDAVWWKVDAVICTLGTTIITAGSQAAFAAIDRDLPIQVASMAKAAGASRFALNSSLGAHLNGNFYLSTKAQAEEGIRGLAFPSYTIVRPSLIDSARKDSRPGERLGLIFSRLLRPLIPKRYRAVKPERIAKALLEGVHQIGQRIVESGQL